MAKNKISEWSAVPANNTDIGGIDIAEGCAPSGINNGIRELMAQVKDMITGADGDNLTVGGNLTVTGTASVIANGTNLGHNWTPVPVDTNTWSDVAVNANSWTDVAVSANTWSDVSVNTNTWVDVSVNNNEWYRQG